ncbi:unnamed protein product [Arabidopsis thaliana]|uniref:Uncharacterized protein n=2 Tax=Arabidopsis thaliana TaxID=3702 RepID=A0A1P8BB23_ARATH|nr:uncharacterized protein AT5G14515 [Arabidopsis thaliana]ANM68799.1 hypothetical protein AT5G14515 [Arabidopsis thaliana]VYS66819.1 unnamed protein product [Arabidopsis thaliana]|eukprot:NP_001330521.1 hypothetical protein AT5G14515 [Arabidopsis thaliana]
MPSTLAWMEERIRRNAMANSRTTIFVSDWRISSNVGTAPDFTIRTLFLRVREVVVVIGELKTPFGKKQGKLICIIQSH